MDNFMPTWTCVRPCSGSTPLPHFCLPPRGAIVRRASNAGRQSLCASRTVAAATRRWGYLKSEHRPQRRLGIEIFQRCHHPVESFERDGLRLHAAQTGSRQRRHIRMHYGLTIASP